MFLVNSRLGLVSATFKASGVNPYTHPVPLIPKLRGHFAEFLHHDYLDRLGILYLSTCVGLGYGRLIRRSRSFSRQHRITHSWKRIPITTSRLRHMRSGFTYPSPYTLVPAYQSPGWATFLRPSAACLLQVRITESVESIRRPQPPSVLSIT